MSWIAYAWLGSACDQDVPPSTVLKMPPQVAARRLVALDGCMASRFVYHQLLVTAVLASCCQDVPPSWLTNTPAPRLPLSMLPVVFSPVAA